MSTSPTPIRRRTPWIGIILSLAGLAVVAWAFITAWGAIVHGHPLYLVLLVLTVLASAFALWMSVGRMRRAPKRRTPWSIVGWSALGVLAVAWIALMGWLRPFSAAEPALVAMESDSTVTVIESPTEITMSPASAPAGVALVFQPGARVDARAYAAVLRPVAEAGHLVVIVKQPLGIAFLSLGALNPARAAHPDIDLWAVGGHSLGGTVAAMDAAASADGSPAAGLMFYASYPANDLSTLPIPVLSISGSNDGLSTPARIAASRANLPADTTFVEIAGASHAQFGDYGSQPGDGEPTLTHDQARTRIADATRAFLAELQP